MSLVSLMNVLRSPLEKGKYLFESFESVFERLRGFKPKKLAYLCGRRLKPYSLRFLRDDFMIVNTDLKNI